MHGMSDSESSIEELTSDAIRNVTPAERIPIVPIIGNDEKKKASNKISPDFDLPPSHFMKELDAKKPSSAPLAGNTLGTVGIKWRVRIVRIYDSEEQWKGVVEIYFHWNLDRRNSITRIDVPIPENEYGQGGGLAATPRPRRMSVSAMTNPVNNIGLDMIDPPKMRPVFLILNDEESHCTEEVYYKMYNNPTMLFGYVTYTVAIHERLELEVWLQVVECFALSGIMIMLFCVAIPI